MTTTSNTATTHTTPAARCTNSWHNVLATLTPACPECELDRVMREQIATAQPCGDCGDYGHDAADHDADPTPTPESAPPGAFIVSTDGQPGNVIGWRGEWVRAEFADGSSVYGPADRVTWRLDDPSPAQVELESVLRAALPGCRR
jgi:hypothetical protein